MPMPEKIIFETNKFLLFVRKNQIFQTKIIS